VDALLGNDLHADTLMPCSGKNKQQHWIAEAATNDEETSSVMFHCIHCIARPDLNAWLNATVRLYRIAHIEWRTAAPQ
jgi:hypothetical protein